MNKKHYRKGLLCPNCGNPMSDEASKCHSCSNKDPKIWKHVWTQDEKQCLVENYPKMRAKELSVILNKNVKSIDYQVRKHFPFLKKHKAPLTIICDTCEKSFCRYYSYSLQNTGRWGNFCSRGCRAKFMTDNIVGERHHGWRGGYFPYFGRNWYRVRRMLRGIRPLVCARCGIAETSLMKELETHHIIPRRKFIRVEDSNTLENLILLCSSCHKSIENTQRYGEIIAI